MSELNPGESDVGTVVVLSGGEFRAWIEQEAVHIKAVDKFGDPVELCVDEVRAVIKELGRLVEIVERGERSSCDCSTKPA